MNRSLWFLIDSHKSESRVNQVDLCETCRSVPPVLLTFMNQTIRREHIQLQNVNTVVLILPSGRRLQSIRTKTSRHKTSFFPSATGLFNKAKDSHWHSFIYLTIISPSNGNYTMHKPPYLSIWLHYVDHSCCSFLFYIYILYLNSFILRLFSSKKYSTFFVLLLHFRFVYVYCLHLPATVNSVFV